MKQNISIIAPPHPPQVSFLARGTAIVWSWYLVDRFWALLMNRPIWKRPWLAQQGAVQTKYKKGTFYQSSVSASLDEDFSQTNTISALIGIWRDELETTGSKCWAVDFGVQFNTGRWMLPHVSTCNTTRRKRNTGVLCYIPLTPIPVRYQAGSPKHFLKALKRRRSLI